MIHHFSGYQNILAVLQLLRTDGLQLPSDIHVLGLCIPDASEIDKMAIRPFGEKADVDLFSMKDCRYYIVDEAALDFELDIDWTASPVILDNLSTRKRR